MHVLVRPHPKAWENGRAGLIPPILQMGNKQQ